MNDNNISVRTAVGCYDFLHPNEQQLGVTIQVDGRQLSLTLDPQRYDHFVKDFEWDEYVPEVIETWLDNIWISSSIPLARVILRWARTGTGQRRLARAYWERERDRAAKALAAAKEDLEDAERRLAVLAEEEDE